MAHDKEESEIAALGNSLILRTICENLSIKELLELSVVNKFWNYEARCVLRDKKKCVAVIDGERPCLRAEELNGVLGSLNVQFYNGLKIIIGMYRCEGSLIHNESVEHIYGNLVNSPWKYLEFQWSGYVSEGEGEGCVLGQFLLRLMSKSWTLKQLVIKDMPTGAELRERNRPAGEFYLPKLKSIQLPESHLKRFPELLPTLLVRAPNVQELLNCLIPRSIPSVPMDVLKFFKKLYINSDNFYYGNVRTLNETVSSLNKLCASEVKLYTLIAEGKVFPGQNNNQMMQDYLHHLNSIISHSSETLRELRLDSYAMYNLVRAELFPAVLKNVEKLTLEVYRGERSGILKYLAKIPLAQVFPRVGSVTLLTRNGDMNHDDSIGLEDHEIIPWPDVKEVRCEGAHHSDTVIKELGILFSQLICLDITFSEGARTLASYFPFRQIWSSLPYLEKLTMRGRLATLEQNFDAEFCGIYPEEAALLREKGAKYLKAVNIVPPFVPITYMKRLKALEVEVGPQYFPEKRRRSGCSFFDRKKRVTVDGKKFFVSKVTELFVDQQMPADFELQLRATFVCSDSDPKFYYLTRLPNPNLRLINKWIRIE